MKITIHIPDDLLESVMEQSGSKTIRGAVVMAMESYTRRSRRAQGNPVLGKFKNFMSQKELPRVGTPETGAMTAVGVA